MEPSRYQQGKIYKIVSPHTDKIYIGSTTKQYLSQRLAKHKKSYNEWVKKQVHFVSSYEIFQFGNVEIILLETYPCNSKDELTARERHWMDQYNNLVNRIRPCVSREEKKIKKKEYIENNLEYFQEKNKQYRENHKDELIQYGKEYRKIKYDCECGSLNISKSDKSKHDKTDKHQTYLMIQTL
jgi:hypothetical protein